jgi:phospholipase/carboxylesterase
VNKHADQKGIKTSVNHLFSLIEHEESLGIPTDKIFLAGFSHGSVIALTAGLTYPKRLAGILALSGYLPFSDEVMNQATDANKKTPIFLAHGTQDSIVPYFLGEATRAVLIKNFYRVDWHSYDMPHSVCMEEVRDLANWLQECLK